MARGGKPARQSRAPDGRRPSNDPRKRVPLSPAALYGRRGACRRTLPRCFFPHSTDHMAAQVLDNDLKSPSHDPGLSQARDLIPRHHHAAGAMRARSAARRRAVAALAGHEDRQVAGIERAASSSRRGRAPGLGRLRAIRKKGKLPHKRVSVAYALEYGEDTIEMHADAAVAGERVVLVDDLIARPAAPRVRGQIAAPARRRRCWPPASSSTCPSSARPTVCVGSTSRCARW